MDKSPFWEFLNARAEGPEIALAYAAAFWPELIEVDGFVLLKEQYHPEHLADVLAAHPPEMVEATINTTYLSNLFGVGERDVDESVWTALGNTLSEAWKARAAKQFPERDFVTTFAWNSGEMGDAGVTLYQAKYAPSASAPE